MLSNSCWRRKKTTIQIISYIIIAAIAAYSQRYTVRYHRCHGSDQDIRSYQPYMATSAVY